MSRDRFDVLERFAPLVEAPEPSFESFLRRRDRKRRNQRIAASVIAIAVFVVPVALFAAGVISSDRTQTPGTRPARPAEKPGPPPRVRGAPPARGVPNVDYVIDLNTRVMTPLPESIIRTAGETAEGGWPARLPHNCHQPVCGESRYAASPDGSLLAYVGTGDERTPQIFIAGIDGTGVRQMTHDPTGATSPAWSPDGTMIAYMTVAGMRGRTTGIFVLDVAAGESTQVTDETRIGDGLQFTPDGSSLLYTGGIASTDDCSNRGCGHLRTVPIAGGPSTVLIGPGTDAWEVLSSVAGDGSLSPDGSLVTFNAPGPRDVTRWVANADGTGLRSLFACYDSIPAGTWSPDGSRIVCNESVPPTYDTVLVVDVATGDARRVARGVAAIWLDDHTLLVEV
jgi:dipeptidyl aminopeptidase/acylaminoacyl peptidase